MSVNLHFIAKEPPATEAQVAAFEKRIKTSLPSDYRAFLVKEGGGARVVVDGKRDVVFPLKWAGQSWGNGWDEAMLDCFYSLDEKSIAAWEGAYHAYIMQRRVPTDLLPIAYDPGSNLLLLGISGQRRGKVYYWAKDFEPTDDPPEPGYDNIAFVADSFTDFLKSLRPMEA